MLYQLSLQQQTSNFLRVYNIASCQQLATIQQHLIAISKSSTKIIEVFFLLEKRERSQMLSISIDYI